MDDSALNQQPLCRLSLARPTPSYRGLLACTGLQFLVSSLLVLVLTSRALAATVTLAWDANTEPNLAGYILHYGNASGSYSTEVDVGNTTMAALSGVDEGQTYYFAATAYNVNGNESTFSNEVRYTIPVDAIPPTAVITSPSDGSSIPRKSTITMTAAASDNVGVVQGRVLRQWAAPMCRWQRLL